MHLTLCGEPRTKKNSSRILNGRAGRPYVAPSKAFVEYEESCLWQIRSPQKPVSARVNVKCVYYMKTHRRVDLANLIEATTDILVKAGVLADDNSSIVAAHDGSRVDYDKNNPRAEIWIEEMEEGGPMAVTSCKMCTNYLSVRAPGARAIIGLCAKLHPTIDSQDALHECEDYNERGG